MAPITHALLDWGHTLFDTADSVDHLVASAARRGVVISQAEAEALYADSLAASRTAEELAKGRDLSIELHRQCWIALWSNLDARCPGLATDMWDFETSPAGWRPYSDTPALLAGLVDRGITVVVLSDVPFDLRRFFDHYGLRHFVDHFVLSWEHGTTKAVGGLFPIALATAGCVAGHALMVGDNNANDGLAVRAGIRTLLLPHVGPGEPRGLAAVLALVDASRA